MPDDSLVVSPGPDGRSVRTEKGEVLRAPEDWELLPPGDAALTRRVKAAGPTWAVVERHRGRDYSRGVWAPRPVIESVRAALEAERARPGYARRREADARRRDRQQSEYVGEFREAVLRFLAFHPRHAGLAEALADAVATHATPVGSGTVARTRRIPVERRAEAAVIAWLRHQTTAYDRMVIPRVKGKRREVRRALAERSRSLLAGYRDGREIDPAQCELRRALASKA